MTFSLHIMIALHSPLMGGTQNKWVGTEDGRTRMKFRSRSKHRSLFLGSAHDSGKSPSQTYILCSQQPFLYLLSCTKDLFNCLAQQTRILLGCVCLAWLNWIILFPFLFPFFWGEGGGESIILIAVFLIFRFQSHGQCWAAACVTVADQRYN